jgi:hypothetical protein
MNRKIIVFQDVMAFTDIKRKTLPPFSGAKSNQSKQQAETPIRLHGATSQMIVFQTVAAMRTLYV